MAHFNLGNALAAKGKVDAAIACWRKAIELDPKHVGAHGNLAHALKDKGRLDEAIACYRKAVEIDPKDAGARTNLAKAERLAAARDKLPAFQNGSYTPASTAERFDLVEWCQIKKLHHTATRLYGDAFAADPKLADDPKSNHRYNAATTCRRRWLRVKRRLASACRGTGIRAIPLDAPTPFWDYSHDPHFSRSDKLATWAIICVVGGAPQG